MKRIIWQSRLTGHRGGGTAAYPDDVAGKIADAANERWPEVSHATEEVPEGRTDDRERAALDRGGPGRGGGALGSSTVTVTRFGSIPQ
jgi:hypothetical protein